MQVRYPAHIRQLKANFDGTRRGQLRHRKLCVQCSRADAVHRPNLRCDTGWQNAKDESRFARALERAGHAGLAIDGDQLPLW